METVKSKTAAVNLVRVTPENLLGKGLFCVKNQKSPGFEKKRNWFEQQYKMGLRLNLLETGDGIKAGFIEYTSGENAWRPVEADDYLFIHCMYVYPNKFKNHGYGSLLIDSCWEDVKSSDSAGMAVMTSEGAFVADKRLFEKNGFVQVDQKGRFELLVKKRKKSAPDPVLIDWEARQKDYPGWHLIYADQCPWHKKAVNVLLQTAGEYGIDLKVHKTQTAQQAKYGPSGFGVFSLLHDGILLEDHYISKTRFENILRKEILTTN